MVKIVRDIASTFKESVATNNKHIQKRVDEKAAFSVKRCQELALSVALSKPWSLCMLCQSYLQQSIKGSFFVDS